MSDPLASFNLPQWDGYARHFGELWRLVKGTRVACALFTHPLGGEVHLDVDWEMVRTQAGRDGMALVDRQCTGNNNSQRKGLGGERNNVSALQR